MTRLFVQLLTVLLLSSGGGILRALPAEAGTSSSSSVKPKRAWRSPQRAPSVERYKQIQRALKNKGYNPGAIDGRWGAKTASALKRFEKDHGLRPDGKLDSLALITLGLGPEELNGVSSGAGSGGASR